MLPVHTLKGYAMKKLVLIGLMAAAGAAAARQPNYDAGHVLCQQRHLGNP